MILALDMSIRPLDERTFKCPVDIWICPFVHWTNEHIQISDGHLYMSIGRMDIQMSIGHFCLSNGWIASYIGHFC